MPTIQGFQSKGIGNNTQIFDGSVSFANSAPINTALSVDIPLPANVNKDGLYSITVTNSSVLDLTVIVKNKETISGTARYPEAARFGIQNSSPDGFSRLVQGWMLGEGARITIMNEGAAVGAAGAFTAYVRVRAV